MLLFVLFSASMYAQDSIAFRFFDNELNVVCNKNKVVFFSLLDFHKDSIQNNESIFYISGKLRRYQQYSNYLLWKKDGVTEEFYESGKPMAQRLYVNNMLVGIVKEFYENDSIKSKILYKDDLIQGRLKCFWENGKQKRVEDYDNGKFIKGYCFDSNGVELPYFPSYVTPEFPGGMAKFYMYIMNNFNMRNTDKIKGKLIASFVVGPDGKLTDIKILRGIDTLVDKAFVEVIKKSPLWKPAMIEGKYDPKVISLPLNIVNGFSDELEQVDFTKEKNH